MKAVRDVWDTRTGRAAKAKEEGPDLPGEWSAYGVLLQYLLKRAGLNQQQLGDVMGYSLEQVASVEQGRRPAKAAFTTAAERALEAGGVLEALQGEVDRAKLPRFFRNFALIEAEVVSRFDYEPLLVPGLLQTEAYARAVFAGHSPPLGEEIIDQHTEARLNRQKLLTRVPLAELSFIINEEALRDPVGSPEVMRAQWQRLLEVAALRNVEVQVMPAQRGFHPGKNGPFVVVETHEHKHLGYFESQGVGCVVSEPAEVSTFALRYGKLRSQALNVDESARLIERMLGET
ncbi:transcriptional regulator [Streptomyces cinereoruber]|uniref:Transcriptional regulator n=1 Tax=Streptomyces cinereoruber TaxID=67260 RepID=A0AAV4KEN8_9ACTN|nr:helix-turn-helix transcriptional regulator [Streptomyces cinereoruber]MBB4158068.1 transcriptional regulator with XRE-family HTH domain [Streptomyces cinereoruber]NIH61779.1 transcriptional regulator with XRE-family HTH domain [Streptomyces cinereoruber]QEV35888.1 XRE family transcriptional regulator [Streptomyces cinereoruber]GGR13628.1 transcriptional regulator [Streptomyces cinereoruber]